MHILIIEDERKLADAIGEGLRGNGYEVVLAHTGESGIRHLYDNSVDMIVLDVMLPRDPQKRLQDSRTHLDIQGIC
jgi:DNA-binding response OmpR family regulator